MQLQSLLPVLVLLAGLLTSGCTSLHRLPNSDSAALVVAGGVAANRAIRVRLYLACESWKAVALGR